MAGVSRSAPSVTTPVAPRAVARMHEDVADRAGVGFAAGLDHEYLAGSRGSRRPGAGRSARAVRRLQVLAHRHVAQRVGAPDHPLTPLDRAQPAEERAADAALLELER